MGDRYAGLLAAFNATLLCLPFIKIVQAFALHEFRDYEFVHNDALRDDGDIQSSIKQKAKRKILFLLPFTGIIKVKLSSSHLSSPILNKRRRFRCENISSWWESDEHLE
jgi:hypothetical protein